MRHSCAVALLLLTSLASVSARADTTVELQDYKLVREDGAVYLSLNWNFELASSLEDALQRGIALHFVTEVDIRQERWYFYNQRVAFAQRYVRLLYQPLLQRWRVSVSSQPFNPTGLGLSLGQSYDTAQEALNAVRRITAWRLASASDLSGDGKQTIAINFKLDLTQLPRPLQIGAAGQSDWSLSFGKTQRLEWAP